MRTLRKSISRALLAWPGKPDGSRTETREKRLDRWPEHMFERTGKKDHEPLNDDDHVARDVRHLKGEFRAALIKRAEQDCRRYDAGGMRTAHKRHRDADETGLRDEIERHVMLVAHGWIDRHHARQRSGN